MLNSKKAFTLIELLIVIAIIGVLAAIVVASLNSARSKANSSAIRSNMDSIRKQAEIWYGNRGTYFLNKAMAANSTYGCADAYALSSTMFGDSSISKAINQIESLNGSNTLMCTIRELSNGNSSYAFYTVLPAGGNLCIDNTNKFGTAGFYDNPLVGVGCN